MSKKLDLCKKFIEQGCVKEYTTLFSLLSDSEKEKAFKFAASQRARDPIGISEVCILSNRNQTTIYHNGEIWRGRGGEYFYQFVKTFKEGFVALFYPKGEFDEGDLQQGFQSILQAAKRGEK